MLKHFLCNAYHCLLRKGGGSAWVNGWLYLKHVSRENMQSTKTSTDGVSNYSEAPLKGPFGSLLH